LTEAEWLECPDPDRMLWLPLLRNKTTERKLRLFACACCRRMWNLLTDDRSRAVIEVAEKYADGVASAAEVNATREVARNAVTSPFIISRPTSGPAVRFTPGSVALSAAATAARYSPRGSALFAAMFAEDIARDRVAFDAERKEQAGVFRDLIGNPFWPVSLDPTWLLWRDNTIPKVAQAISEMTTKTSTTTTLTTMWTTMTMWTAVK
jgi:hypothetical protein